MNLSKVIDDFLVKSLFLDSCNIGINQKRIAITDQSKIVLIKVKLDMIKYLILK